jgi:hypothetical protein
VARHNRARAFYLNKSPCFGTWAIAGTTGKASSFQSSRAAGSPKDCRHSWIIFNRRLKLSCPPGFKGFFFRIGDPFRSTNAATGRPARTALKVILPREETQPPPGHGFISGGAHSATSAPFPFQRILTRTQLSGDAQRVTAVVGETLSGERPAGTRNHSRRTRTGVLLEPSRVKAGLKQSHPLWKAWISR